MCDGFLEEFCIFKKKHLIYFPNCEDCAEVYPMEEKISDQEIMEQIHMTRKWIEKFQELIEEHRGAVKIDELRKEMSRLNHLKLEARKRGLLVD